MVDIKKSETGNFYELSFIDPETGSIVLAGDGYSTKEEALQFVEELRRSLQDTNE